MASRGQALIFFLACFGAVLGCGARTDTLLDDGSFGGNGVSGQGQGGGQPVAGNQGRGGSAVGGNGAGGRATAGSTGVGGFGAVGGSVPFGGFGGAGAVGGSGAVGGFGAFSGFGAVGGISQAGAGGSGGIVELCVNSSPNACDRCLCQSCGTELDACFTDLGCALIFACVQQTQCQGFGCYQAATCRGVIDQFGGLTGGAVTEVFSLVSCTVTRQGACGCN